MAQQKQEVFRAEGLLRIHCCESARKLPALQRGSATKKLKTSGRRAMPEVRSTQVCDDLSGAGGQNKTVRAETYGWIDSRCRQNRGSKDLRLMVRGQFGFETMAAKLLVGGIVMLW